MLTRYQHRQTRFDFGKINVIYCRAVRNSTCEIHTFLPSETVVQHLKKVFKICIKIWFSEYSLPKVPPPCLWGSDMPWDGLFSASGMSSMGQPWPLLTEVPGVPPASTRASGTQFKGEKAIVFQPFLENCDFGSLPHCKALF